MIKQSDNATSLGHVQYKGFCIDLLEKISKMCGFNYTIKLVDDGFHGSFVEGRWNGLVSELIDKVKSIIDYLKRIILII